MGDVPDASTARSARKARMRFAIITMAAVIAMLVTASLGRWQLRRAAEKEAYQAQLDARAAMPALEGHSLLTPLAPSAQEELQHRQVVLQGEWLPQYTVYLDNRQMQGRPGFYVLTPLRLRRDTRELARNPRLVPGAHREHARVIASIEEECA